MNNADIEYIRSISEPAENDPQIAEINGYNANIDSIIERVQSGNGHNPATCSTCKEVLEHYNSEQTTSV